MTEWICAKCSQPVEADGWCTTCEDGTLAVEVLEPEPATPEQRAQIRYLYRHHGLHSTPWCLTDLSQRLGRPITDLKQLTTSDYNNLLPDLTRWSYGVRR